MGKWIVGVLVVAGVSISLFSGCGGGDEASADVTKAQFTKEAEAICAERKKDWDARVTAYNKTFEANRNKGGPEGERERAESLLTDSLIPLLRTEMKALEDLDVPEADEEKIEEMLQKRSQALKKVEDGGVEALFAAPFEPFEKEAAAYGIDCSLA